MWCYPESVKKSLVCEDDAFGRSALLVYYSYIVQWCGQPVAEKFS